MSAPHDQQWVEQVLSFWFSELDQRDWFNGCPEVDVLIRQRFGMLHSRLAMNPPSADSLDAQGHVSAVEDRVDQARSVELFASLDEPALLRFAEQHKAIVDRFGRFPHRNAVLGRGATPAETEFMRSWRGFK